MKTGPITYSARDRGRKFRGQERNFDTAALARVVNSGEVQERVKNRDMWGYYGHWPRMLFGMQPGEGGLVQRGPQAGKVVKLEPAFVTTSLKADTDGNITHEAEFLDNATGRLTHRAMRNKTAGFSSCIDCTTLNGVDVPRGFYGFDFVSEPNFTTNRGYALDGVFDDAEEAAVFDCVLAEATGNVRLMDSVYQALQADYEMQSQAMEALAAKFEHAEAVNRDLVAYLAKVKDQPVLDSAAQQAFVNPGRSRLSTLAREFGTMKLDGVEPPPVDAEQTRLARIANAAARLLRR
jgi:hypothetical protein